MSQKKKEPIAPSGVLPPVVHDAIAPPAQVAEQPAAVPAQPASELPASIVIEVPLGPLDQGYLSRHVDARLTTTVQCESLHRLVKGLRLAGEKLEDGKPVASYADAVKWLLEQLGQRFCNDERSSQSVSVRYPTPASCAR